MEKDIADIKMLLHYLMANKPWNDVDMTVIAAAKKRLKI